MKILVICTLVGLSFTTHAEMYKCVGKDGKTKYQASKCQADAKGGVIKLKVDKPASEDPKMQMSVQQAQSASIKALAAKLAQPVGYNKEDIMQRKLDLQAYQALTGQPVTQPPATTISSPSLPPTQFCKDKGNGRLFCF